MYSWFAFALVIATALLFFLPQVRNGPFHYLLPFGAILWFGISVWMKSERKRRMEKIHNRFGGPYPRIREIGKSRDSLQDYPRNIQRMYFFSQGDLGKSRIVFAGCSLIWLLLWIMSRFAG